MQPELGILGNINCVDVRKISSSVCRSTTDKCSRDMNVLLLFLLFYFTRYNGKRLTEISIAFTKINITP